MFLAILSLLLCHTAWASEPEAPARGASQLQRFEDPLGHRIEWAMPPQRIISLSPSVTEILFAIGHDAATIVGRTRFCDFPPAVAAIPQVGGVVDPSLEAILMLSPDLVLATRGNPIEFMESLVRLRVPVYAIETRGGLEHILQTIEEIGLVTGRDAVARAVATRLRARCAQITGRTDKLAAGERPRVYYGRIEGAHWTAGPGSYIDGLIRCAGGENLASVAQSAWSALSLEVILARDPKVYLGTFGSEGREKAEQRALRVFGTQSGWRGTSLGRNPRIFLVHEDRLQRPGPRVIDVLEEFARFLHPGLWGDRGPALMGEDAKESSE
jgi:iron complex transport system substrate-binding protein